MVLGIHTLNIMINKCIKFEGCSYSTFSKRLHTSFTLRRDDDTYNKVYRIAQHILRIVKQKIHKTILQ